VKCGGGGGRRENWVGVIYDCMWGGGRGVMDKLKPKHAAAALSIDNNWVLLTGWIEARGCWDSVDFKNYNYIFINGT
jgi:hypothetical protein